MFDLTGLAAFDWLLVGAYVLGVVLLANAWRRQPEGRRLGGLLATPLVGGLAVLVGTAALEPGVSGDVAAEVLGGVWPLLALVAIVVVVAAVVDVVFTRVVAPLGRSLGGGSAGRDEEAVAGAVGAVVVAALVVAALVGVAVLDSRLASMSDVAPAASAGQAAASEGEEQGSPPSDNAGAEGPSSESDAFAVAGTFDLPGRPMGLALTGPTSGFASFAEGSVVRFELPEETGQRLRTETVLSGLAFPRGMAVVGDVLVVANAGSLACEEPPPARCKGEDVAGDGSIPERELRILNESRASLLAYDIAGDGSLEGERLLVDELPVANSEHGVNGVTPGSGNEVYVSIGNLDRVKNQRDLLDGITHPNRELLGTVVRVDVETGEHEVVARGLRNVYGLAVDHEGGIWGVDNDGGTWNGWRGEEVLHIEPGAHYGYPEEGTFPPHSTRTDGPVWVLEADIVGSAGVEWVEPREGSRPGLLIGSCGGLHHLELRTYDGTWRVGSDEDLTAVLDEVGGCVTGIGSADGERYLAVVFGSDLLHVLERTGG